MSRLLSIKEKPKNKLTDRFLIPPFSVFDVKQGYWIKRKKDWLDLGIESELGRDSNLTFNLGCFNYEDEKKRQATETKSLEGVKTQKTSIFDPVLCEIVYRWFSRKDDNILDPFAGGSVRGIVCSYLNRNYLGFDLSEEQINANRKQYIDISSKYDNNYKPQWVCMDSINIPKVVEDNSVDLIFSCPPYYNLEVYSDKDGDISNCKTYEEFLESYRKIIKGACDKLKENRFAIFVVSNIRDKKGIYYNLVGDTINAFQDSGLKFYNDAIYINSMGTLPVRVSKQFNSSRKLGKLHQNVLVFFKGDPREIKEIYGEVIIED